MRDDGVAEFIAHRPISSAFPELTSRIVGFHPNEGKASIGFEMLSNIRLRVMVTNGSQPGLGDQLVV